MRNVVYVVLLAVAGVASQQRSPGTSVSQDFQINGTLVDESTGAPVAHARVALAPVTQRNDLTTITTGDDGRFVFEHLAAGKYSLMAQARGYLAQSFNQHDQLSTAIVVGPDLDSSNLSFRLPRESAISGVVIDEAGEGVRNAQVSLYFAGLFAGLDAPRMRGRGTTDDQGAYRFPHLSPGRYIVAVSARPWYAQHPMVRDPAAPPGGVIGAISGAIGGQAEGSQLDVAYPITFYGGGTDVDRAAAIVLGHGESAVADVVLQPVRSVHVRIDNLGDLSGRNVSLESRVLDGPPIQVQSQQTGDGKRQEIAGISPGHYTLRSYVAGKAGDFTSETREVDIDENGMLQSSPVNNYIPVSAELRFEAEAPRQADLQLVNKKTRAVFSERVGSDGNIVFKQGVTAGSYEVALGNAPDVYLKSMAASGARVLGRTVEVVPGAAVKLTIAAARGEGEVAGVALRNGRPMAGVLVILVPADPEHNQILFRRDQSDSDGTFTLPSVVPGVYTLVAIENGWELEWTKAEVVKPYLGQGVAVRVQPKGKYDIKLAVQ
jgi:protocatechuate 3,4-dioxygenase beta subunit